MEGGISLYITGVTILERIVELINPPINTIAKGAINGLGFQARGINPQMAVMDVSTTGKKRVSPALLIASSMLYPSARNWLVKSTSNSEFLTCMPDKPMKPIIETIDIGWPVINSITTPPRIPNGIIDSTMMIPLNVLNCSNRTPIKRNVLNRITDKKFPPSVSPSDSASPDSL